MASPQVKKSCWVLIFGGIMIFSPNLTVRFRTYLKPRGNKSQEAPHLLSAERHEQEVVDRADEEPLLPAHEPQLGPDLLVIENKPWFEFFTLMALPVVILYCTLVRTRSPR